MIRDHSKFGSTARPQTKPEKNMVFLVETETVATLASTQRWEKWAKERSSAKKR